MAVQYDIVYQLASMSGSFIGIEEYSDDMYVYASIETMIKSDEWKARFSVDGVICIPPAEACKIGWILDLCRSDIVDTRAFRVVMDTTNKKHAFITVYYAKKIILG